MILSKFRDKGSKTKTHLELNFTGDVKCNRKNFCKHIWSKRKPRGKVGLLLNRVGDLVTKNTKKDEVLDAFSICFY